MDSATLNHYRPSHGIKARRCGGCLQQPASESRVEFSTSPIVLLCGGKVPEKGRPDDPEPRISTIRHAITRSETPFELFRPEEITDWSSDGVYKNLMDFERDLAGICSLVVIVLESAGAIAELGAFSQLDDLRTRLMVCVSSETKDDPSFIRLGILRHLGAGNEGVVREYPWDIYQLAKGSGEVSAEIVSDIINDINEQLSNLNKSQIFNPQNVAHVMTLIYYLLTVFVALKLKEISKYLLYFDVRRTDEELKRKLFLLEKFNLVKKGKYSDSHYFRAIDLNHHRIRFRYKSGHHYDALRLKAECTAYYNRGHNDLCG